MSVPNRAGAMQICAPNPRSLQPEEGSIQ
jgi:hypothetical protein